MSGDLQLTSDVPGQIVVIEGRAWLAGRIISVVTLGLVLCTLAAVCVPLVLAAGEAIHWTIVVAVVAVTLTLGAVLLRPVWLVLGSGDSRVALDRTTGRVVIERASMVGRRRRSASLSAIREVRVGAQMAPSLEHRTWPRRTEVPEPAAPDWLRRRVVQAPATLRLRFVLDPGSGWRREDIFLSVRDLDHQEEVLDLAYRIARVACLTSYRVERQAVHRLDIVLKRQPEPDTVPVPELDWAANHGTDVVASAVAATDST